MANPAIRRGEIAIDDEAAATVDGVPGTDQGTHWLNNLTFNGTPGQASVYIGGNSGASVSSAQGNVLGAGPRFAVASINPAIANFRLQDRSPAIDRGSAAAGDFAPVDFDGTPRPQGAAPDIGAFEFADSSFPHSRTPAILFARLAYRARMG